MIIINIRDLVVLNLVSILTPVVNKGTSRRLYRKLLLRN